MNNWENDLQELASKLKFNLPEFEKLNPYRQKENKRKNQVSSYSVGIYDTLESASQKTIKLINELGKNYDNTCTKKKEVQKDRETLAREQIQKQKAQKRLKGVQETHQKCKSIYLEQLKRAQQVQKEEQQKRKALVQELQNKISTLHNKYKKAGQVKIQKFRENQSLIYEVQKLKSQIKESEKLYDAQLNKKEVEMNIQIANMKQKIKMMNKFKSFGAETQEKIDKAKEDQQKIRNRLGFLEGKEEDHKNLMARAHLTMEQYKKSIIKINDLLKKKERQASTTKEKIANNEQTLKILDQAIVGLDKEYEAQVDYLKNLENQEKGFTKQVSSK